MIIRNYLGVTTASQYLEIGEARRYLGPRVAYSLLDVGSNPSPEQVRIFEDVCFTLRLSNGTFRTSFRNRFADLNALAGTVLQNRFEASAPVEFQDRAVSHALTSAEWASDVMRCFPHAHFEASDLMLFLLEIHSESGTTYIAEPDGVLLQAIRGPFVVSLCHRESIRFPFHRLIAGRERRRFDSMNLPAGWSNGNHEASCTVRQLSLVHPEARALAAADPRFQVRQRSVFDVSPDPCDVLRTMNILNAGYFSESQLLEGIRGAWKSLRLGGVWVVGRTMEDDFTNHATLLERTASGWRVIERLGLGSEVESLALGWRPPA